MTDMTNDTRSPMGAGAAGAEQHVFSVAYEQRKRSLLAEAAKQDARSRSGNGRTRLTWRAAAAAAAVCVALPVAAYAAITHADLFDDLLGTGFRESVPATQAVQPGGGDKADVAVTLPAKDYVDVDPEAAEALLGAYVSDEPVAVRSADGHTLTITNAVRSDSALLYRFTLEKEGGQTALAYSEQTNRTKGAMSAADCQMSWSVAGDEFLYVDLDESTDERVVGYAYSALGGGLADGQPLSGTLWDYSEPVSHVETAQVSESGFTVPCTEVVPSEAFANDAGGTVELSPLGLALDNQTGLFAAAGEGDYSMAHDPIWTRKLVVNYADGTSYVVFDEDASLDNTSSTCVYGGSLVMAFNRLVDPSKVRSVDATVVDCPSGNPDDLRDANGNLPTSLPEKIVTYLPRGE